MIINGIEQSAADARHSNSDSTLVEINIRRVSAVDWIERVEENNIRGCCSGGRTGRSEHNIIIGNCLIYEAAVQLGEQDAQNTIL